MLGKKLKDFADLTGDTEDGVLTVPQVLREVAGVPVQQVSWRRSGARSGDAVDRRGDGRRREFRRGVRQSAAQRRYAAAGEGTVFISVNDRHKPDAVELAKRFAEFGFELVATRGTAAAMQRPALQCKTVFKVNEGRPNAVDLLKGGIAADGHLHGDRRAFIQRRESDPPGGRCVPRAVYHDNERRQGRGRSRRLAASRSDPRLESAGDSPGAGDGSRRRRWTLSL